MELFGFIFAIIGFIGAGLMIAIAFDDEGRGAAIFFCFCFLFVGVLGLIGAYKERTGIVPNKSYKGYEIDTVYTISNGRKIGLEYQIKEKTKK